MLKESSKSISKASPQTRIDTSSPCSLGDRCILFFVKYPERGAVKNRLAVDLTAVDIVELYRNFVLDLISMLEELRIPFQVCYFPDNTEKKLIAWLGNHYSVYAAAGKKFGRAHAKQFYPVLPTGISSGYYHGQ